MSEAVSLVNLIAPAFYPVHNDIMRNGHTYYDLSGGRGSTKSSFVSLEIVLGIMADPAANAVVFRKVASTIGVSVFEQILWAISALGVEGQWRAITNPYRCTYLPTGQVIIFRGLDKAKKLKSIKVSKGYIKYMWLEELDEFSGEEEIRSVQQSVLRGGPRYVVFKTFNPPISIANWANKYVLSPRKGAYRHKSCYLDVPVEWLGQQFIDDAEDLRQKNYRAYQHEYLGDAVGTGGEVFDNLEIRALPDEEIAPFDNIFMGIDWGWYPDPFQWVKMHYDSTRRTLYIYDELRLYKTPNAEAWNLLVLQKGVTGTDLITADSAEPKSIGDFREYGALCRPAIKGPDSIRYGIKWLQSLSRIVIDPARCPNAAKEFSEYEYERTESDEIISSFPDHDNHCLTGDTTVNTVDGDICIRDLVGKTGQVYCYDEENSIPAVSEFHDVRMTGIEEIYEIELEDGRFLRCSGEHPILTPSGWARAEDLAERDFIKTILSDLYESVMISRIVKKPTEPVYNMEVDRYHNFSVNNGLIVHNCIDASRYALERVYKKKGQ